MTKTSILNYYSNPNFDEQQIVKTGDKVFSITDDHDLTKGKEYFVNRVISKTLIEVVNDKGILDVYSVEWFKLSNN